MDLPDVQSRWDAVRSKLIQRGVDPENLYTISAVTGSEVRPLLFRAAQLLAEAPPISAIVETPVYRVEADPKAFSILQDEDGWHVNGQAIERAAKMTYWEQDQSVRRFQRILETLGVEDALRKAGVQQGDTVFIGDFELEWHD
jgi:GTP-binding protein